MLERRHEGCGINHGETTDTFSGDTLVLVISGDDKEMFPQSGGVGRYASWVVGRVLDDLKVSFMLQKSGNGQHTSL